ncbi:MAG: hypothetical protein IT405_03840 [Candidatus Yanofskybacteria bacterium]|nr:hypothetical protein [Candidatus Yanofskybacteria bacterium]
MRTSVWIGLGVAAFVAIIVAYPLMVVSGPEPTTTTTEATKTVEPATRLITVGGTGLLQEERGEWFVRGKGQPEVALGAIDAETRVFDQYRVGLGGSLPLVREHFLGHRVTIIATVEVAVDDKEVFRAVRTESLVIFRHSDGLPER